MSGSQDPKLSLEERLRILYPMVHDQRELPRYWSAQDKYNFISLSQNHLRVQYKGHGKTHKDASSVRAEKHIPASCGIYYFEIKIISKGRDGYMGVGLSAQGVSMNRLPGWDKHSYGYHGDDGHSFCSSGTGQSYGPTFTTGDVIGCGLNLVDGSCFYTKNGHNLGVAFTDLPSKLYPTVGLQTPGEVVDANFGQEPFVFDIEGEMVAQRTKVLKQIENFPTPGRHGDWQVLLHQMVSTFLVHHGYSSTAEAFNRATGQTIEEDLASIKNRQAVQNLVLTGKMGEAIKLTEKLYPMLLEENPNLKFMLKVRQFVEMCVGVDSVENIDHEVVYDAATADDNPSPMSSSPVNCGGMEDHITNGNAKPSLDSEMDTAQTQDTNNSNNVATNGNSLTPEDSSSSPTEDEDPQSMEVDQGAIAPSSTMAVSSNMSPISNPLKLEKLLRFGQHLQQMLSDMESGRGVKNEVNSKMLHDAFSLICYTEPTQSPVGWQLDQQEREGVCAALNTAILESKQLPGHPPLEVALVHSKQLLRLMAEHGLGTCAFANVDDFLRT